MGKGIKVQKEGHFLTKVNSWQSTSGQNHAADIDLNNV